MHRLRTGAVALLILLTLACAPARAQLAEGVQSVGITVSDMDRAVAFYRDVLTFRPIADREVAGDAVEHLMGVFGARLRIVTLGLGQERIDLIQFLSPPGRPIPADMRSNDEWFQHIAIVVDDMDAAYARLRERGVRHASTGPQTLPDWNPDAGGISAFYFRDPDGNHLEIIQFPAGNGDPRWQQPGDRLFLGIDHTAIVVGDTQAALGFYRDTLGLAIAGGAENYGPEQEHLNNVFGARLRITALRGSYGPGIELLEYLAPPGGRPMPIDTAANDLWYWHVQLGTADAEAAAAAVLDAGYDWVSPGAVAVGDGGLGFDAGVLVRDPTGHAMLLVED